MNPDALTESAIRNREARSAQLSRLLLRKPAALAAVASLRETQADTREKREAFEVAASFKFVPGFFPTPAPVIERMLGHACITAGERVLEPSAGRGDLAAAAIAAGGVVDCFEIDDGLRAHVAARGLNVIGDDFTAAQASPVYDVVLMNPPFERRQDIAHVKHAFNFLAPGGRLVAVVTQPSGMRLQGFADLHSGQVCRLPAGSFLISDRSTGANTSLVILNR